MPIKLSMDQHIPRAITNGLRLAGIDILTAFDDSSSALDDPALLTRASQLERVLFSMDDDLLMEATRRQRQGAPFQGVIYGHQLRVSIGQCIADLEVLAKAGDPDDFINNVVFLPL